MQSLQKKDFAKQAGIHPQQIASLVQRGLPLNQNGTVPLDAGLAWLQANHVRRHSKVKVGRKPKSGARDKESVGDEIPAPPAGTSTEQTYWQARLRHETAKAKLAELEVRKQEGAYVNLDDIVAQWQSYVAECKARLRALPVRAVAKMRSIVALTDDQEVQIREALLDVVDQALLELSEYKKEKTV